MTIIARTPCFPVDDGGASIVKQVQIFYLDLRANDLLVDLKYLLRINRPERVPILTVLTGKITSVILPAALRFTLHSQYSSCQPIGGGGE